MRNPPCNVPWFNTVQFSKVYKNLYSSDISDKRWAIDQISVWDARASPSLPIAIETSAILVRAVIQDMLYMAEKSFCQEKDIESLYSIAIVRFINLVLEAGKEPNSRHRLTELAVEHNIPEWIVELRHDATHAYSPPLAVLRMGAEKALEYLEETFWKVEAANIKSYNIEGNSTRDSIYSLVSTFRKLQFLALERDREEFKAQTVEVKNHLKKFRPYLEKHSDLFLKTFVEPRVFIVPTDLQQLLSSGHMFIAQEDILTLPDIVEEFWRPVILLIHEYGLIPRFLETLLLHQEHGRIPICQKVAISWTIEILRSTEETDSFLSTIFSKSGLFLDYKRLIYATMKSATKYSLSLLEIVTSRLGDKSQFNNLFCTLAMQQGMLINPPPDPEDKPLRRKPDLVFTLDDVEEDIEELKRRQRKEDKKPIWSMAPAAINFSELPLGAIINPLIPKPTTPPEEKVEVSEEPESDMELDVIESDQEEVDDDGIFIPKLDMMYSIRRTGCAA